MESDRERVRSRTDIVALIGERVQLRRTGKNYIGLCPFHEDKRPSFSVNPEVGSYRCWSCGAKGDVFTWVMKMERVEFAEALTLLATRAGIELTGKRDRQAPGFREQAAALNLAAVAFFADQFRASQLARSYLMDRGIDDEVVQAWELGYAPEDGTALPVFLKKLGHSLAMAKEIGLLDGDENQGYVSKFRGRLMFAIRDERGQVVGFGGRAFGDAQPKYLNTGETPLFAKRRTLYGLHRARDSVGKSQRMVLVEGYFDVIACHRAGIAEAVATLGTALSEEGAQLIQRWAREALVLYDADEAGRKAAQRASELLGQAGVKVAIALLPPGDDPDSLLRRLGPEAVRRAAEGGMSPLDFRILEIERQHQPDEEAYWQELTQALAEADPLQAERHILPQASKYPGLRDPLAAQRALRERVARLRKPTPAAPRERREVSPRDRPTLVGPERIILLAAWDEGLRRQAWPVLARAELFTTEAAAQIAAGLVGAFPAEPPVGPPTDWIERIEDAELRSQVEALGFLPPERLTEESLADAVAVLERKIKRRALVEVRTSELDDDERLRLASERARALHGAADPEAPPA